jgi:hypothetical protein
MRQDVATTKSGFFAATRRRVCGKRKVRAALLSKPCACLTPRHCQARPLILLQCSKFLRFDLIRAIFRWLMRVSARGGTSPSRVFCILSPARKATRVNSSGSQGALVAEDTGTVTLFAHLRAPERARSLIQTLKNGMSRQRASVAAVVLGGVVGAAVGMAYLGGAVAQSATVRGQAYRMAGAYDSGFTDEAVAAAVGGPGRQRAGNRAPS